MPRQSAKDLLSHVEHVHLVLGEARKWLSAGIYANAQYLLKANLFKWPTFGTQREPQSRFKPSYYSYEYERLSNISLT